MFLTCTEIAALTNRTRQSAQIRALRHLGIEHKVRADGSVVVLRAHVEHILGGTAPSPRQKSSEPNWSAL